MRTKAWQRIDGHLRTIQQVWDEAEEKVIRKMAWDAYCKLAKKYELDTTSPP